MTHAIFITPHATGQCVRALRIGASEDLLVARGHQGLPRPGVESTSNGGGNPRIHGFTWIYIIIVRYYIQIIYIYIYLDIHVFYFHMLPNMFNADKDFSKHSYRPVGGISYLEAPLTEWRVAQYGHGERSATELY